MGVHGLGTTIRLGHTWPGQVDLTKVDLITSLLRVHRGYKVG